MEEANLNYKQAKQQDHGRTEEEKETSILEKRKWITLRRLDALGFLTLLLFLLLFVLLAVDLAASTVRLTFPLLRLSLIAVLCWLPSFDFLLLVLLILALLFLARLVCAVHLRSDLLAFLGLLFLVGLLVLFRR